MPWSARPVRPQLPGRLRRECFKRDDWTCQECGYPGEPDQGELHCDHIIPAAEGGPDTLDNLVTRCVRCHNRKTQQEAQRGRIRRSGKRPPPRHPADAIG